MCELVWGELGKFVKRRSGFGENAPRRTKNFDARIKPYRHAKNDTHGCRLECRETRVVEAGTRNRQLAGEGNNVPTQKVSSVRGSDCAVWKGVSIHAVR
jgi:hypothetical protein